MKKNKIPTIALMYDFDKTLCTTDMQNYELIPNLGVKKDAFWNKATELAENPDAPMDRVLAVDGERIEGISDFNLALVERAGSPKVEITLARAGSRAAEDRDAREAALAEGTDAGENEATGVYTRTFDLSGLTLDGIADQKGFAFPSVGFLLTGRGIVIADVVAGGPADKAGLKQHDFVLEVAGERATTANFSAKIRESAGKPLELVVRGESGERRIVVTPDAVLDEKTGETVGRAQLRYGPSIELSTVRHGPIDSIRLAVDKVARMTIFQFTPEEVMEIRVRILEREGDG